MAPFATPVYISVIIIKMTIIKIKKKKLWSRLHGTVAWDDISPQSVTRHATFLNSLLYASISPIKWAR